jgi:hypothetical protein
MVLDANGKEIIEEKKVETPGQGGGGGTAGADAKASAEADALAKAELETLRKDNKVLRDADEKRKRKELEDQGKLQELVTQSEAKVTALEARLAAADRRAELQLAVTAHQTEINKAWLMKQAERIDAETGREKPLAEVIKAAEDEGKSLIPAVGKTHAFGATGGSAGGGTKESELVAIKDLHKRAAAGNSDARKSYTDARIKWIEKYGSPPPVM